MNNGGTDYFAGRTVLFTVCPSYAYRAVPAPSKPTVARNAGAGSFAAGRDVYIVTTLVNGNGETSASMAAGPVGTSANDQIAVTSPTLSASIRALSGTDAVTGYNLYEADVATGGAAPVPSAFKQVNSAVVAIGTAASVNNTGSGSAPPTANKATITTPAVHEDFNVSVIQTVVHEFIHAFGMPHKCGYWDWRTPRRPNGHSCCMNYFNTWLVDSAFHPLPNTVRKQGNDVCGRTSDGSTAGTS